MTDEEDDVPKHGASVTRRELLRLSAAAGAAVAGGGLLAACAPQTSALSAAAALPPPETKTLRILNPFTCDPEMWLMQDYLREEGFTDIQYIDELFVSRKWLTERLGDVALGHGEFIVPAIDAGVPILALAGLHAGCLELWGAAGIGSIKELRGKVIPIFGEAPNDQFFAIFSAIFGYVGIDAKDVRFVKVTTYEEMLNGFIDGKFDALMAFAHVGVQLRRNPKNKGHVLLDLTTDKPWSDNFCCHLVAHRDWARANPIATKRVTRAVLRASDRVAKDKARAARDLVAQGYFGTIGSTDDESILNETIAMLSYDWRERDPVDTMNFFALRLADVKLITKTPQQIISQGTDFAYMRQLRKELTP